MSPSIRMHHVHFSYENITSELLSDATLTFHPGWTSLCGVNGSGKTTLFHLISGRLTPTQGHIEVQGRIYKVPQDTEFLPSEWEEFCGIHSRLAIRLRTAFAIEADWGTRWSSLSMGERKKLQLAIALSLEPDILLVDEPSNHVDENARQVILEELERFRGVGILSSHDRLLLNELCTTTIFIDAGTCTPFHAPYEEAKQAVSQLELAASRSQQDKKRELAKTQTSIQRQWEKIDQRKGALSKRNVSKHDNDARAKINLAKVTGADFSDSRKKRVLETRKGNLQADLSEIRVKKMYNLGVFFSEVPLQKRLYMPAGVIETGHLQISYPEIRLEPGEKMALTGTNGAGKSTFMQHWWDQLKLPHAVMAKQELFRLEQETLLRKIHEMPSKRKGDLFTLVSCLGSDPKSLSAGSIPSPGMWQKIVMAKAILEGAPVLFLDESTNHMDLVAIEVLEEALRMYQGSVVVISHDRRFVEAICSAEFRFSRNGSCTKVEKIG